MSALRLREKRALREKQAGHITKIQPGSKSRPRPAGADGRPTLCYTGAAFIAGQPR
jgi:hypothetical protein